MALIQLDWSATKAQQRYRRRFGIESSYRQLGQVRAHTNSRNVALCFVYLALALLLVNLWVFLRCLCTRIIGQGPFRLELNQIRLARFIAFLRRAIEQAMELLCPSQFIRVTPFRDSLRLISPRN